MVWLAIPRAAADDVKTSNDPIKISLRHTLNHTSGEQAAGRRWSVHRGLSVKRVERRPPIESLPAQLRRSHGRVYSMLTAFSSLRSADEPPIIMLTWSS